MSNLDIEFRNKAIEKGWLWYDEKGNSYLTKCPKCGLENWAPRVATGECAWCGYKAPKEEVNNG